MEFTGERFVPGVHGMIELEHVHRYLQATRIASGKAILDIACGEGYGSAMLAAHAPKVIGVDISPQVIEHARTRYQRDNLEFRVGTCADIPLADSSIDLVVSFETLEHHDQHDKMMEEVKRVLRPGGLLLLSCPDKLHYSIEPGRLNPYHVRELYKEEFKKLLSHHFENTMYFAQRVLYGSGIFVSEASAPLNSYLLSKDLVREFEGLSDPTYWIALASDSSLPDLNSSVLEQPIDESEVLRQLKQENLERERQAAHLTEGLGHRDGQIANLNQALVESDEQKANLSKELNDRDREIVSLNQALVDRDGRISELNQQLKQELLERERQVAHLNAELGHRGGQFASVNQALVDRDSRIAELNQQVKQELLERERQMAHLNAELGHRDGQIASLNQTLTDRDGKIADFGQWQNGQLTQATVNISAQERWQKSLLRAATFTPMSLRFPNAWVGHLPFAAWLVENFRPETFVELGTHSGNSFFTVCQAVAQVGTSTRCYAVDTWQGDEHAGQYDESIFDYVSAYNQQHYRKFARLLRMKFDEAREYFPDGSVTLLHIDGLHTYEAVRWDFESWLPKLAPGAVVLFHDTNVRERNFGVWKFWKELQAEYPCNLEFAHSHGLGVLQLNDAPEHARLLWLDPRSTDKQTVVDFFASLGSRYLDYADAIELREHIAKISRAWAEHDGHIIWRDGQITHLNGIVAERDRQIAGLTEQIRQIMSGRFWRITKPMRSILGLMRGEISSSAKNKGRNGSAAAAHIAVNKAAESHVERIFDSGWYLEKNPDVKAAGLDPLDHFKRLGGIEERNPHPLFDASWYLTKNPDVRNAAINPLDHFNEKGWKEGRNPHPLFDVSWYLESNPDVQAVGMNPLQHYVEFGWTEGRSPHRLFDGAWYLENNGDVRAAGMNPFIHFLENGWVEGRCPSPIFNLPWYRENYEDVRNSGMNPLIHYVEFGLVEGRACGPVSIPESELSDSEAGTTDETIGKFHAHKSAEFDIRQYLPEGKLAPAPPSDLVVDIIIPVFRGFDETVRCLKSILADTDRPNGRIRVIDDCSPDSEISAWLTSISEKGTIELVRNSKNLGFVKSVNIGIDAAGRHDVVLLNSDTEVPQGFLRRLAGTAYTQPKIATVTPFSNTAGEMAGFPDKVCRPLPARYSLMEIDNACQVANGQRSLEIPTGVGFCMYIRRACLDEIGSFDADAFGRGYGEETDFCQKALAKGWKHLLACNTFVYHVGEVSFGQNAPERSASWETLVSRYPGLPSALRSHLDLEPTIPAVFAATVSLFQASHLPTVLIFNHGFDNSNICQIEELMLQPAEAANIFALRTVDSCMELSVPSVPGHPTLKFPATAFCDLSMFLQACPISRIQIQHWLGIEPALHELIDQLNVPVDLTVHDHFSA